MTDRTGFEDDDRTRRMQREIVAPEGVVLHVRLATFGERATAAILDLLIIFGSLLGLFLVLMLMPGALMDDSLAMIVLILVSFALRSFYFAFFELRWRGSTPGKRAFSLRVIDRQGGPLRADAVMARNLMREVELFMPLSLLLVLDFSSDEGLVGTLALIWTGILALLPLFNRDRLRAGDMIAGTWVIVAPKHALLPDVATQSPARPVRVPEAQDAPAQPDVQGYRFTEKQLTAYGVYELQVLEDVLRRKGPDTQNVLNSIVERICRKIDYKPADETPIEPRAFLDAFYRAQRARLETDLAFGRRRADKHDRKP